MESINSVCHTMGTSSCRVVVSEMVSSEVSLDVQSICYEAVMTVSLFAACSVGIHVKVKHHFPGRAFTALTPLKIQLPQLAPNSKYLDARRIHEITNKCN